MAAPRKKKTTPPFDVTGIDFSVITTALKAGGSMVEQIMNSIQYGSPEVRLLLREECDIIVECRVCRALFRALPNFIAHKRVYCQQAYSDFVHDIHFQSATAIVPPQPEMVVVEPEAPENAPPKSLRQARQTKEKGKEQRKDGAGSDGPSGATVIRKTSKALGENSNGSNKPPISLSFAAGGTDKSGAKTRSQQSEKPANETVHSLNETVHRIESGQLGKSQEYIHYTLAAEKMEKDKLFIEQCEPFHLTPIATTACAVFVNRGRIPCDLPLQPASSQLELVPGPAEGREKEPMKSSPKEGAAAITAQEEKASKTASSTDSTMVSASSLDRTKKVGIAKATIRFMTKVVKELRQKKEEQMSKLSAQKDRAQKSKKPILSDSKTPPPELPRLPDTPFDTRSLKERTPLPTPSPTPSSRSTNIGNEADQGREGGSLRAVVKRCLTGRPGSVRVSPFKFGNGADLDSVSEAGSYSDRAEVPPPLLQLRQDITGEQCAMDMDNLCCKVCNKAFAGRKSLMYHCQARHSGQRTIYPCPYCPRVFYYFWGLTRHLNTNHKKSRSNIDRMRKSLRSKAYKQSVVQEHSDSRDTESDSKDKIDTHKFRPSVQAKKIVAASKSTSLLDSAEEKSPSSSLYTPSRRRRVEVITSPQKPRKSPDMYKKVYTGRKAESLVGSPPAVNPFSSPFRTRKLVAKAMRTTRSKRVYNTTTIDSPPTSPEKVTKRSVTKTSKVYPSSKEEQSSTRNVDPSSSEEQSSPHKVELSSREEQNRTPTVELTSREEQSVGTVSSSKPQISASDQQKEAQPEVSAGQSSAEALKLDPQINDRKASDAALSASAKLGTNRPEESSDISAQMDSVKKKEAPIDAKPQSQAGTRTSLGATVDTAAKTQSNSKVSGAAVAKGTSPQVTGQGKSMTRVSTNSFSSDSGLLHICPHCQRAFGRKISLDSHMKICSKSQSSAEKRQQHPSRVTPIINKSNRKNVGSLKIRTSLTRGDTRSRVSQARAVLGKTKRLRERSAENSESMPGSPLKIEHLQDCKLDSRNIERTSTDSQLSNTNERPCRAVKKTDSKASGSRDSSVDSITTRRHEGSADSVRTLRRDSSVDSIKACRHDSSVDCVKTRRSDGLVSSVEVCRCDSSVDSVKTHGHGESSKSVRTRRTYGRTTQLSAPAEHMPRLRRESDSSRDNMMDSRSRSSNPERASLAENLLTLSRQRLSEQLLAATSSRDKDTVKVGLTIDSPRSSTSSESVMSTDFMKTDPVLASPGQSSPEKSASQRSLATTVLRKSLKGKLTDLPKNLATESAAAIPSDSASQVKQGVTKQKASLQDTSVVSPAVQSQSSAKPDLFEKSATRHLQSTPATRPATLNPSAAKPVVQDTAATNPVVQDTSAARPVQNISTTKTAIIQNTSATKPSTVLAKMTAKPMLQGGMATKVTLQDKPPTPTRPAVEKSVMKVVLPGKSIPARPAPLAKPAAKPVIPEGSAASPVLQNSTVTKSALRVKSVANPALGGEKVVARPAHQEAAVDRPDHQDAALVTPEPQEGVSVPSKAAANKKDCYVQAAPEAAPKVVVTVWKIKKETPSAQQQQKQQHVSQPAVVEAGASSSGQRPQVNPPEEGPTQKNPPQEDLPQKNQSQVNLPQKNPPLEKPPPKYPYEGSMPQENPSELNQRPKRKRRAPARVMDSEITLPTIMGTKKKYGADTSTDHPVTREHPPYKKQYIREEITPTSETSSQAEASPDSMPVQDAVTEEAKVERKAVRGVERVVRSRTYVVEPSHAGRLTCQDIRKVEGIVDEAGLICLHCDQQFTSVSNLRRHAIRHLGWKRFKCRLCRFCSYNRSECNTHIIRAHYERVRRSGNPKTDAFITDLNRQAASMRSLKKRQTLSRQRQEGEEEVVYTCLRPSVRKANTDKGAAVDCNEESSSHDDRSSGGFSPRRSTSRGKATAIITSLLISSRTSAASSFNISTRNSPRKFDTRPYPRDESLSLPSTHKGVNTKRNIFSQILASFEEGRKADGSGGECRARSVRSDSQMELVADNRPGLSLGAGGRQSAVSKGMERKMKSEAVKKDQGSE